MSYRSIFASPPMRALALVALLVLSGAACSTTRPSTAGQFLFTFEGMDYAILSFREPSGQGGNYLVRRVDGRIVMRAADLDQDGVIESVLFGDVTLSAANRLYVLGLEAARENGLIEDREAPRLFTFADRDRVYALRSVVNGPNAPFNTLSVTDAAGFTLGVGLDDRADGSIDRVLEGDLSVGALQQIMRVVLDQCRLLGRAEERDGRIVVSAGAGS